MLVVVTVDAQFAGSIMGYGCSVIEFPLPIIVDIFGLQVLIYF
jgi:hypothetical protein